MSSHESKQNNDCGVKDEFQALSISTTSSDVAWRKWRTAFSHDEYYDVSIFNGIPVVLMTELTDQMRNAISKVVPQSQGLGAGCNDNMACTTCRTRLPLLLRMRDFQGRPYFMNGSKKTYPVNFWPLWDAARSGTIQGTRVVTPDLFGVYTSGEFEHFSISTSTPDIPEVKDQESNQRLLDKYIPMMTRLFTENGVEGIHNSLETLIKVLPTVTYGGKLLESAVWFRKHIHEDFGRLSKVRQLEVLCGAITDLKYCREIGSGDATLPLYHQLSKNTLDALAVCNSVEQLGSLLKDRLSPLNYQVKTAPAKDGNVDMAMKHIGDFGMKLMTIESALEHKAVPVERPDMCSSSSAFGSMRYTQPPGGVPIHGAAGFANRSKSGVKTIRTMRDLMAKMPPNLEVRVTGKTPVYAVDFTGQNLYENGVYQTPFSWGFKNNQSPSIFGLHGWCNVVAVLPMKTNYLFICEGSKASSNEMDPCCHVNLLTGGYNKSCGQAFGNLKNHMKLQIEGSGPYAIGVGVSLDSKKLGDDNPPINGSITLRSDGTVFTIN